MRIIIVTFFATICIMGCSPRYAVISISTFNSKTNAGVYSKVYSGTDGQYIGDAPALNYLVTKNKFAKNKVMSLIVESNCLKTQWKIIVVSKWAKTKSQAYSSEYVNKVQFILDTDPYCLKN